MRTLRGWLLALSTVAASALCPPASHAQMPYGPGAYPPGGYGGMPVQHAAYPGQMQGPLQPVAMMGEYGEPSGEYSGQMGAFPESGGDPYFCPYCGGQGCENCGGLGDGVVGGFLKRLLPYTEGGRCAPRWYDVALDSMYLKRDSVGERVDLTSAGLGGASIGLSTAQLDYEHELGMRFTGALQVLPGCTLEFTYLGLANWASVATVSDPTDNLFSVYSDFGLNPPGGFDETDQSQFQSVRSSNTIDNFELNVRKRWTGANCRMQGSWLWGARYVYLLEDLEYFTLGRNVGGTPVGQSDTDLRARNSLTGVQVGGDLWSTVIPGIAAGLEMKAGVFGNYAKQNTTAVASSGGVTNAEISEEATNNDIAFVGDASLIFIYRTSPNWTIRSGYTFLYIDGVALAADNFNTANPFVGRTALELDDNSKAFYHGAFTGFEWMW